MTDHPLHRYVSEPVRADLARKMVFVGGPRQVGKTTFALRFLGPRADESNPAYFNWDNKIHRERMLRLDLPENQRLLVLDEIHKYAGWRNWIKGYYDTHKSRVSILVTGSARLDYYRKGGDSLQGRYHYYRLHPLSLREINPVCGADDLSRLLRWSGFPEPFLSGNDRAWRRWQREHRERFLKEDLRDLEHVKEVTLIEELLTHLPSCVGSPLSVANLSKLTQVAFQTVDRWISILERLYVCFRIPPYGSARIRAVRKEQKLYFWDWTQVPGDGPRFENLVANQLLKYCHWMEDTEGYSMELRFLRDTDKREVDFVVLKDGKPAFAVECKTGEKSTSSSAHYFRQRTPIPRFYQVHRGQRDYGDERAGVRVLPFTTFCRELKLP